MNRHGFALKGKRLTLAVGCLLLLFAAAGSAQAQTILRVNLNATGTPIDGSSFDRAYRDINSALGTISSTSGPVEVWVTSGTYTSAGIWVVDLAGKIDVSVLGGFAGWETLKTQRDWVRNPTIADARNLARVARVSGAANNTVIDGITLTNGYVLNINVGVGIDYTATGATGHVLRNCKFTNNRKEHDNTSTGVGAGIAVRNILVNLTIDNCEISGNEYTHTAAASGNAYYRGAGLIVQGGTINVTNTVFEGNRIRLSNTSTGGGIEGSAVALIAANSVATFNGCKILRNEAVLEGSHLGAILGGTIYVPNPASCYVSMTNCEIAENLASIARASGARTISGATMYINSTAICTFTNCDIRDNLGLSTGSGNPNLQGGGMWFNDSAPVVSNCRIVGNTLRHDGGPADATTIYGAGILIGGTSAAGAPTISDSVICGNATLSSNQASATVGGAGLFINVYTGAMPPVLSRCVMSGNLSWRGAAFYDAGSASTISNCLISGNTDVTNYGVVHLNNSGAALVNCTVFDNQASEAAISSFGTGTNVLLNCLLAENNGTAALNELSATADQIPVNCLFDGNAGALMRDENSASYLTASDINANVPSASGNIEGAALFDMGTTGTWTANAAVTTVGIMVRTVLTDSAADFPANLVGHLIRADKNSPAGQARHAYITTNTATQITVAGDFSSVLSGAEYQLIDMHLAYPSAAIDQGAASFGSVSAPATDFDGNPRADVPGILPDGGAPIDIGAYEVYGPLLSVVPPSVDFGTTITQYPGPGPSTDIVITNNGSAALEFVAPGFALGGASPTQFVITSLPAITPLAPGTSRTVSVAFDPIVAGNPHTATLDLVTSGSPGVSIPLTGVSVDNSVPTFTSNPIVATNAPVGADYLFQGESLAAYATDANLPGDQLSFRFVPGTFSGPGANWLSVDANTGALSGTPGFTNGGVNSWTVEVSDMLDAASTATLQITVAYTPPAFTTDTIAKTTATIEQQYGKLGQTLSVDVNEPAGKTFSVAPGSFAGGGTDWLTVATTGGLSGVPTVANLGVCTWTVVVEDIFGSSDTAVLEIPVAEPNKTPASAVSGWRRY